MQNKPGKYKNRILARSVTHAVRSVYNSKSSKNRLTDNKEQIPSFQEMNTFGKLFICIGGGIFIFGILWIIVTFIHEYNSLPW